VFIPFKEPVVSIEDYAAAFEYIEGKIIEVGYDGDKIGLDHVSKSPVQSFYLPCTNFAQKEYAFLKKCGWDNTRIVKQRSLDVSKFRKVVPFKHPKKLFNPNSNKEMAINEIIEEYKRVPVGQGKRNHAFYMAGLKLSNYLDLNEVEIVLRELAGSEQKMLDRIPRVISSIRAKSGTF
jgi:hypothetical protein